MWTPRVFLLASISCCSVLHAQIIYDHAVFDDLVHYERDAHRGNLKDGGPPVRGFDMKYLRCAWQVDPAVRAIAGSVTSYFTATADLDEVLFDLSDTLVVDQVTMHGSPLPYAQLPQDILSISLPTMLTAGQLDSLTVTYHGTPPTSGFGSFATSTHNGIPVLWTLSEPYGAKDWWPCKQDLNDKIDSLDTYVTTPSQYRAAGSGSLAEEITTGSNTTYHWRHRYPIDHYLIATAVTNYQVDLRTAIAVDDTIPLVTYSYPEDSYVAGLNAGDLQQVMPLYGQLFGPYPFAKEKYGQAQFGWGGGMEHQTMSYLGAFNFEIAAHELAHQWFGDKVTCGSWQDIWLHEGFATYLTGLCYNYLAPQYWQGWKAGKIASITSVPDGSVHCTDTLDVDRLFSSRLTYNKGAMVLHMLRWVCGDSAFYHGVRAYLNDPQLAYGTARAVDLRSHLEASSGLDLGPFFADWYTGEGYPTYTTAWTQESDGAVNLTLYQSPSDPTVTFFALPVPIRFKNADMDSTVVLDNALNGQAFTFHLPFMADSALFDPDLWLISGHDVVTRVNELSSDAGALILYPNPANDVLNWQPVLPLKGKVQVRIFDVLGNVVLNTFTEGRSLSLADLPAGGYELELRNADRICRARFVKQ